MEGYISLEENLRPILLCMELFGLYHAKCERIPKGTMKNNWMKNSKCSKTFILRFYCALITTVLVLNVLRCIPAFWIGLDFVPGLDVNRIICTLWFLQCAINRVIMFSACRENNHLQTFFKFYNKITTDTVSKKLKLAPNSTIIKRKARIWTGFALTFVFITEVWIIIICSTDLLENVSVAITNPFSRHISAKILFSIIFMYCSAGWIFPVCLFLVLSATFRCQLRSLNDCVENVISKNNDSALDELNEIRVKHFQYAKAIKILDQDVGKLLLGSFTTGIGLICFILYQFINDDALETLNIISYSFWLMANLFLVSVSSVSAALVNSEAHAALAFVYEVDIVDANSEQLGNLNMFLSILNGPAIGFSTMDIVTITKELILTLLGIFGTYFFLLLQFKV